MMNEAINAIYSLVGPFIIKCFIAFAIVSVILIVIAIIFSITKKPKNNSRR